MVESDDVFEMDILAEAEVIKLQKQVCKNLLFYLQSFLCNDLHFIKSIVKLKMNIMLSLRRKKSSLESIQKY